MNEADAIYLGEQMCVRVCSVVHFQSLDLMVQSSWIYSTASGGVFGADFLFKLSPVAMSKAQCFAPLCVLELYHNFHFYLVLRRTAPTNFTKISGLRASSPNKL